MTPTGRRRFAPDQMAGVSGPDVGVSGTRLVTMCLTGDLTSYGSYWRMEYVCADSIIKK